MFLITIRISLRGLNFCRNFRQSELRQKKTFITMTKELPIRISSCNAQIQDPDSNLNFFNSSRVNGFAGQSSTSPMRKPNLIACKSNSVSGSAYYLVTSNNNRPMGSSRPTVTIGQKNSAAVLAAARQRKLQARSADNLLL